MLRPRAIIVLAAFVATLALGLVLLAFFEPEVQDIGAAELVDRKDEAREFLVADYFFILVYGVLSPIAIWRFGGALAGGSPPGWMKLTAVLLVAAGLVDATENTLLLSATDSVSEDTVDAAHALVVPKVGLFVAGALLAIVANFRAARTLAGR
jgi:protein-S-isoprenylcysteine O-methyltransferase Ste14